MANPNNFACTFVVPLNIHTQELMRIILFYIQYICFGSFVLFQQFVFNSFIHLPKWFVVYCCLKSTPKILIPKTHNFLFDVIRKRAVIAEKQIDANCINFFFLAVFNAGYFCMEKQREMVEMCVVEVYDAWSSTK